MIPHASRRPKHMTNVIANLSMSLDGFVARHDDSVGPLFDWYAAGDVEVPMHGGPTAHLTAPSARFFRWVLDRTGAYVVGRRLYDHTNGWNGRPPTPHPVVVLTHDPPATHPEGGVPYTFCTSIEDAIATARDQAGGKDVSVSGAVSARAALDAGLLDEIHVNLAPVILGDGIPFLAGTEREMGLELLEAVPTAAVTHLRYAVRPIATS